MRAMADVGAAVFVIRVKAEVHRHPFRLGEYQSITPNPGHTQARSEGSEGANALNCYFLVPLYNGS
jgi:hypothetical protein